MSFLIDRSKGRDHIYSELKRIRDTYGEDRMDMGQICELRMMEMEEEKKQKQKNSGYYQKYWDEVHKTRALQKELDEIRRQQEFDAAVEQAVAERMGKTAETPAETETNSDTTETTTEA